MEFALSQAVASGDAFEHRPSECGHCVQNFLADLDLRDLPGEAAGLELGADDTLPTADLRFYPAALVVPCGRLPGHAAVAADLGNMAIPNGWIPRRLRSGHCVLWRRYNHIQGLPIPFPQQIPCGRGCKSASLIEEERLFESAYDTAMNWNRGRRVFPRLAGINVLILQEASTLFPSPFYASARSGFITGHHREFLCRDRLRNRQSQP